MNVSALNTAAINAEVKDVLVRSVVMGYAYGMASVTGRMRARIALSTQAQAQSTPVLRKVGRSVFVRTASALAAPTSRILARALVQATGEAQATPLANKVVMRVNASLLATALVNARVARRSPLSVTASAQASLVAKRWARSPDNRQAQAVASLVLRGLIHANLASQATAQSQPVARVARRMPMALQAQATGFVGSHTTVLYPFDELALEENTFIVGFEDNIFYVR